MKITTARMYQDIGSTSCVREYPTCIIFCITSKKPTVVHQVHLIVENLKWDQQKNDPLASFSQLNSKLQTKVLIMNQISRAFPSHYFTLPTRNQPRKREARNRWSLSTFKRISRAKPYMTPRYLFSASNASTVPSSLRLWWLSPVLINRATGIILTWRLNDT